MQSEINLLKSVYDKEAAVSPMQTELRKFSFWAVILTVAIGIIVLGIYFVLTTTHQTLSDTHAKLTAELDSNKTKESLMAVIKSRIDTVTKAMDNTKPVDKMLANIYTYCRPPKLAEIHQDDTGRYNLHYVADSLGDAMGLTAALAESYNQKQISNIMLDGFSIDKSGMVITFSFLPNWANL